MQTLNVTCATCNKIITRRIGDFSKKVREQFKKEGMITIPVFCSQSCLFKHRETSLFVCCQQCNKEFYKTPSQIRSKNNFCSHSCAATYNNTHTPRNRLSGLRRSKLECWLEGQLTTLYPNLEIHFNRKDAINSELDIYIPSLKLAFELNGIFHYEPIFGEAKLQSTQNNDHRKFQACGEAGISLCIVDTSAQRYVKPRTSQKYLDIMLSILKERVHQPT